MSNTDDGERIVAVTEKGQATIPKSPREKHGISAPGRVKFVESESGEIVVRPVGTMREFRGLERSDDEEGTRTVGRRRTLRDGGPSRGTGARRARERRAGRTAGRRRGGDEGDDEATDD